jgi:hypothetical protein
MAPERAPIPWFDAEPGRLAVERQAMATTAPDLVFDVGPDASAGRWRGRAPRWPCEDPEPDKLEQLIGPTGLSLEVRYSQGFPAAPAWVVPLDPHPAISERLTERTHVNGDGTLCLVRTPGRWRACWTAAELVTKAAGWLIWYQALDRGLVDRMPEVGIYDCDELRALVDRT